MVTVMGFLPLILLRVRADGFAEMCFLRVVFSFFSSYGYVFRKNNLLNVKLKYGLMHYYASRKEESN